LNLKAPAAVWQAMGARRFALATAIVALFGLMLAPAASATFHLIQVREVYLGSALTPESKYVELQMYASGQDLVNGHALRTYDGTGKLIDSSVLSANVGGDASQSTILLASPAAEAEFGLAADFPLASASSLSPAGGAVCWEELDCVSWGGFKGSLPSPAENPAAAGGVPQGSALRRTVARGCATALDSADDSDSSADDFALVAPQPRPNAVAPTEQKCASTAGSGYGPTGGGGEPNQGAPQTTLRRKPPKRSADRTPTFRFGADEAKAGFQCKLDKTAYKACRSPFTSKKLGVGAHAFKVRAIDSDGRVDPSPASYRFRVVPKAASGPGSLRR
jgi:hypothetical protein